MRPGIEDCPPLAPYGFGTYTVSIPPESHRSECQLEQTQRLTRRHSKLIRGLASEAIRGVGS